LSIVLLLAGPVVVVADDVVWLDEAADAAHVASFNPTVNCASPSASKASAVPAFKVPTYALKLYIPHGQTFVMFSGLWPLNIVRWPRLRRKDCTPRPIGTSKAVIPAGALKVWVLLPDDTVKIPGAVKRATTKTESAI
jgi:hypothetical protein